mgnify:CR=1 FL=1
MALIEQTLFGQRDKVEIAIERLRQFEPAEGYWLAFSGGKDSVTIHHLAKMAGVRFDAHYSPTTIDPPELVKFIRREYGSVTWERPKRSMWEAICANKWPPTRQMRYCCEEFKEGDGLGRLIVTGIRWEESTRRKGRRMVEACLKNQQTTYLHPIIDWTATDVWQFIRENQLAYCSLYDEGFKRIGCVLCPMGSHPKRDIERWPNIASRFIATFDRVIAIRQAEGRRCSFATGEEMFEWWIQRNARGRDPQQPTLFE